MDSVSTRNPRQIKPQNIYGDLLQMARINIEDDIESREEFRKLLKIIGGNWDEALGKLVRFFRLAQKHYGKGEPVTKEEIADAELECIIKSGWAIPLQDGYQVLGADKQFAWYIQKVEAGKHGGRPKKNKPDGYRTDTDRIPDDNRDIDSVNPLTPSPSPSPSPTNKEEEEERAAAEKDFECVFGKEPAVVALLETIPSEVQETWVSVYGPDRIWIEAQIKKAAAWWFSNEHRHTTSGPISRFVNNWLRTEQERLAVPRPATHQAESPPSQEEHETSVRYLDQRDQEQAERQRQWDSLPEEEKAASLKRVEQYRLKLKQKLGLA